MERLSLNRVFNKHKEREENGILVVYLLLLWAANYKFHSRKAENCQSVNSGLQKRSSLVSRKEIWTQKMWCLYCGTYFLDFFYRNCCGKTATFLLVKQTLINNLYQKVSCLFRKTVTDFLNIINICAKIFLVATTGTANVYNFFYKIHHESNMSSD